LLLKMFVAKSNRLFFYDLLMIFVNRGKNITIRPITRGV